MNYYSIPGTGVFGGIKTAAQFVDFLNELGAPACLVTPDGHAPQWFFSRAPVLCEQEMLDRLLPEDHLMFSLPYEYERFRQLPCRLIYHCQGHDPAMIPITKDPNVTLLSAWKTATQELEHHSGHAVFNTGICVSSAFYYRGDRKIPDEIAFMPRRGAEILNACRSTLEGWICTGIDGLHEIQVAEILQRSSFYLATSVNECFGLPALEAMAAGCVVITVPVIGGREYLLHEETCFVADPDSFHEVVYRVIKETPFHQLQRIREQAMAMSYQYTPAKQKARIRQFIATQPGMEQCQPA